MFQSVPTSRVSEEIAGQIKRAILSGKLKPGDKLPTERELVDQFRSSRVSVREAVRALEHLGLVRIKRGHGGGTYVSGTDHHRVAESFWVRMQLSKGTLNHLTEARLLLEPGLCRLAAERATAQDLAKLEAVVKQQEAAVRAGKDTTSYDLKFHRLLIDAARNPILALTTVSVIDLLVNALQEARVGAGLTAHVVNFHRAIYNALCERDGEKAAQLMADHVADIQRRLQPHLIRGRGSAGWISAPLRLDEASWDQ